jgi:hypothetical protein
MSFGVRIASEGKPLPEGLMSCLAEVRVEQTLDAPTTFALRFQIDIGSELESRGELRVDKELTIGVPDGPRNKAIRVLVSGPIEKLKHQYTLGGPGSWLEIHGRDRRAFLARECRHRVWTERGSDAIRHILSDANFDIDVQDSPKRHKEGKNTLNQADSDLEFIQKIAHENHFSFWIEYTLEKDTPSVFLAKAKAHVRVSPPSTSDRPGAPAPLVATADTRPVQLNATKETRDDCPTVSAFEIDVDLDRPVSVHTFAVNEVDGEVDSESTQNPQSGIERDGKTLAQSTDPHRCVHLSAPGDVEDARSRAAAAAAEAAWFANAKASTTAHMFNHVLEPHQVVAVVGLDPEYDGAYQVKSVTHVINASDHYMDFELRSNAVGKGKR